MHHNAFAAVVVFCDAKLLREKKIKERILPKCYLFAYDYFVYPEPKQSFCKIQ